MMADTQREILIEQGLRLVHERGFTATGVREIAAEAGVPQGSFTNHFRSKDAFGVLLLDRYVERLDEIMASTLWDARRSPRERLDAYFDEIERRLAAEDWRIGCLVPDLAAEIPFHSEALRRRLCAVLEGQVGILESVLADLLGDDVPARSLACFLLAAWHGSLLRMKVERDPSAVRAFRDALRHWLPHDEHGANGC